MMTQAAFFGGCRFLSLSGASTASLAPGVLMWVVNAAGAGNVVRLPDARTMLQRGINAFVVVGNTGSSAFALQNSAGTVLVASVTASAFIRIDLIDNSTAAGVWNIKQGTLGGGGGAPVYSYLIAFLQINGTTGGVLGLYNTVSATSSNSANIAALGSHVCSSMWNSPDTLFIHSGISTASSKALRSYVLGTVTSLTSSTFDNGNNGAACLASNGIAYHGSGLQIQEYSPGSNAWTTLSTAVVSSVNMPSQTSSGASPWKPDEVVYFANSNAWNSPLSANNFYQHTRATDSWAVRAASHASTGSYMGMWSHESAAELHRGPRGGVGSSNQEHRRYTPASNIWATTTAFPSASNTISGGQRFPAVGDEHLALVYFWEYDGVDGSNDTVNRAVWNNTTASFSAKTAVIAPTSNIFFGVHQAVALTIQ